jgi:4-hydroxy-tetrahydrodipicolinate reductase
MDGRTTPERPLRVVVAGAAGRMGQAVRAVVAGDPRFEIAALVDPAARAEEGWFSNLDTVSGEADGVVEFTRAGALALLAPACARRGWPLVSGTTGLLPEDEAALREASARIPVLRATNLSLGMALVRRCLRLLAAKLPKGTQFEIVEIHHAGKQDAPSGTAWTLFEDWKALRGGQATATTGRSGRVGPRREEEVGLHAVRMGEVVGEHHLLLALPGGERLELVHRVARRESFARGALEGLLRLRSRPPGRYGWEDLLEG